MIRPLATAVITLLLPAVITAETVLLNFGANTFPGNWNHLAAPRDTSTAVPLIDATGAASGLGLRVTDAFGGNETNNASASGAIHPDAEATHWTGNNDPSPGASAFTLSGLRADRGYTLTFYAGRDGGSTTQATTYSILGADSPFTTGFVVRGNTATREFADVRDTADGVITFQISSSNASGAVIINALRIDIHPPGEPPQPPGAPDRDEDPRPNIVLINVDDMGATDPAVFGSDFHETPHIDQLAADGLRFTNAYSASAVCSPTRAAILTGRYPSRIRITNFIGGSPGITPPSYNDSLFSPVSNRPVEQPVQPNALPTSETTYAEVLRAAGYATLHLGKWHLGSGNFSPENHGFDRNIGGGSPGQPPTYFDPYGLPNLPSRSPGEYLTDREADEAEAFIRANATQPFLLNYWPYAVHTPLEAAPTRWRSIRRRLPAFPIATPPTPPWSKASTTPSARSAPLSTTSTSPTTH